MGQRSTVLVVDDEEICLTITERMLQQQGLPVLTARDGEEAVSLYRIHGEKIGCVVMDIQMPRMNGIEAFRRLKVLKKDVRVIIATGHLSPSSKEQLAQLRLVGYLKKPFSFQELACLLDKALPPGGEYPTDEE